MTDEGKKLNLKYIIVGSVTGALLLIYLGFSLFFAGHYFFRTTINGVDVSLKNEAAAQKLVQQKATEYKLTITGRDEMTETLQGADIELTVTPGEEFYAINNFQNGLIWIKGVFVKSEYTPKNSVTYNKETVEMMLDAMSFFQPENIHLPQDASISDYDATNGCYYIMPEYYGTNIYVTRAKITIKNAIKSLEEKLDLSEAGCYSNPRTLADDEELIDLLGILNTYTGAYIRYDWNDEEEIIDGSVISEWLKIEAGTVKLDEEAVAEYVKEKSLEHDTYGKKRDFTTYNGDIVTLPSGAFGWKTDRDAEKEFIIETVSTGETAEREPVYTCEGAVKGAEDIGPSYVEINLSAQHLYLWVDSEVVLESDFVSGSIAGGHATPSGVFGLTYKTTNATLRGPDYESFVYYWMPFNGDVGMHDATWRRSFGGDIYLESGSHGCINLPKSKAVAIYDYVYKGFPVICYY